MEIIPLIYAAISLIYFWTGCFILSEWLLNKKVNRNNFLQWAGIAMIGVSFYVFTVYLGEIVVNIDEAIYYARYIWVSPFLPVFWLHAVSELDQIKIQFRSGRYKILGLLYLSAFLFYYFESRTDLVSIWSKATFNSVASPKLRVESDLGYALFVLFIFVVLVNAVIKCHSAYIELLKLEDSSGKKHNIPHKLGEISSNMYYWHLMCISIAFLIGGEVSALSFGYSTTLAIPEIYGNIILLIGLVWLILFLFATNVELLGYRPLNKNYIADTLIYILYGSVVTVFMYTVLHLRDQRYYFITFMLIALLYCTSEVLRKSLLTLIEKWWSNVELWISVTKSNNVALGLDPESDLIAKTEEISSIEKLESERNVGVSDKTTSDIHKINTVIIDKEIPIEKTRPNLAPEKSIYEQAEEVISKNNGKVFDHLAIITDGTDIDTPDLPSEFNNSVDVANINQGEEEGVKADNINPVILNIPGTKEPVVQNRIDLAKRILDLIDDGGFMLDNLILDNKITTLPKLDQNLTNSNVAKILVINSHLLKWAKEEYEDANFAVDLKAAKNFLTRKVKKSKGVTEIGLNIGQYATAVYMIYSRNFSKKSDTALDIYPQNVGINAKLRTSSNYANEKIALFRKYFADDSLRQYFSELTDEDILNHKLLIEFAKRLFHANSTKSKIYKEIALHMLADKIFPPTD